MAVAQFAEIKSTVQDELKRTFNPEFLNRIDDVIVFHALTREDMRAHRGDPAGPGQGATARPGDRARDRARGRPSCSSSGASIPRSAPGRSSARSRSLLEDPFAEFILRGSSPPGRASASSARTISSASTRPPLGTRRPCRGATRLTSSCALIVLSAAPPAEASSPPASVTASASGFVSARLRSRRPRRPRPRRRPTRPPTRPRPPPPIDASADSTALVLPTDAPLGAAALRVCRPTPPRSHTAAGAGQAPSVGSHLGRGQRRAPTSLRIMRSFDVSSGSSFSPRRSAVASASSSAPAASTTRDRASPRGDVADLVIHVKDGRASRKIGFTRQHAQEDVRSREEALHPRRRGLFTDRRRDPDRHAAPATTASDGFAQAAITAHRRHRGRGDRRRVRHPRRREGQDHARPVPRRHALPRRTKLRKQLKTQDQGPLRRRGPEGREPSRRIARSSRPATTATATATRG